MCLAILKPEKIIMSEAVLRDSFIGSPDGAGIAYVKEEKVVVEKGFFKLKDFLVAYEEAFQANKDSPFLIHFRNRTMGARDADNCHPFTVAGGAMIHNGGFNGTGAKGGFDGPSDTALWAKTFGEQLDYNTVFVHQKEIESAIGFNKVALLYGNGKAIILNGHLGTWVNGVWYSHANFTRGGDVTNPLAEETYHQRWSMFE